MNELPKQTELVLQATSTRLSLPESPAEVSVLRLLRPWSEVYFKAVALQL